MAEPDANNPLEKKRDPHLIDKLTTAGELSGILNLIIFKAKEIAKTKTITRRSSAEMFREYADQSASVGAFLGLFCEYVTDGIEFWTPSEPIYEAYKKWCGYRVGEVVDVRYFGKQLKNFCGGRSPKRGKDKDRKSISLYPRLNFDSMKYNATVEALRLSMSQSSLNVSQSNINSNASTDSDVSMSLSNKWILTIEKFGNPTISPIQEETPIFIETIETLRHREQAPPCFEEPEKIIETLIETKEDPGFQRFKSGMKKRTCCLCGRSFPYDLTPYFNKGQSGYICTTCLMEGPPAEPAKADSQTKLEAGA